MVKIKKIVNVCLNKGIRDFKFLDNLKISYYLKKIIENVLINDLNKKLDSNRKTKKKIILLLLGLFFILFGIILVFYIFPLNFIFVLIGFGILFFHFFIFKESNNIVNIMDKAKKNMLMKSDGQATLTYFYGLIVNKETEKIIKLDFLFYIKLSINEEISSLNEPFLF